MTPLDLDANVVELAPDNAIGERKGNGRLPLKLGEAHRARIEQIDTGLAGMIGRQSAGPLSGKHGHLL